jgi:hypothetical protein
VLIGALFIVPVVNQAVIGLFWFLFKVSTIIYVLDLVPRHVPAFPLRPAHEHRLEDRHPGGHGGGAHQRRAGDEASVTASTLAPWSDRLSVLFPTRLCNPLGNLLVRRYAFPSDREVCGRRRIWVGMLVDFEVIKRAQTGDSAAFNEVVLAYRKRVLGDHRPVDCPS